MNKLQFCVFRCKACGTAWLGPRFCCDRKCVKALLRPHTVADSLPDVGLIKFSVLLPLDEISFSLRRTISEWLKSMAGESAEFVVISASVSESSLRFIRRTADLQLRLLRVYPKDNLACRYNLAAQAARGQFLLLSPGGAPHLTSRFLKSSGAALSDSRVGLIGCSTTRRRVVDTTSKSGNPTYRFHTGPLAEGVIGIRAEVFSELGGLDERFTTYKLAMTDLQYRLICNNYRLVAAHARPTHTAAPKRENLKRDRQTFARKYRRQLRILKKVNKLFGLHRYPDLSVAIATRNYGHWLPRCLNSILRNWDVEKYALQIVVTDDCSTDNTALVLERFRRRYPRIINVVRRTVSNGVPAAKNLAIRRSIGSYIAFHDADDEFYPHKVRHCLQMLANNPRADFLTHDYNFVDTVTGESCVLGDEWFGNWRPPGVWVFPQSRVRLNEQMICGYEELEWSKRFWHIPCRVHIDKPLAVVNGEYVTDRWKTDREIAGRQSVSRWLPDSGRKQAVSVFACFGCGNQYFNQLTCCGQATVKVPLVTYMAISSAPSHAGCTFSIIVFSRDDLASIRKLVSTWRRDPHARHAEWIFVHCHPSHAFLNYLRQLAREIKVKAVFSPREAAFIYSHDANRAARSADGELLLFLDCISMAPAAGLFSKIKEVLSRSAVGIAGMKAAQENTIGQASLSRFIYGMRREVFWELGAMDEDFTREEVATLDLQYRALLNNYHLDLNGHFPSLVGRRNASVRSDLASFRRKHSLARNRRHDPFSNYRAPEISIAVTTRNESAYLPRCLDSVLQSGKRLDLDFQVVVVNDCSTDDTRLIVEDYRQRFPRQFIVVHNERSLGVARARNLALSRCIGEYVAGVDVKDRFLPQKLRICLSQLKNRGADFLSHRMSDATQPDAANGPRNRTPAYSTWVFRNGVVQFNEQMLTEECERDWFKRSAPSLRTIRIGSALTSRQAQPRKVRGR